MKVPIVESGNREFPSDVLSLVVSRRLFCRQAQYSIEYIHDPVPTSELLIDLKRRGLDLLTFVQRDFLKHQSSYPFHNENEVIGLLRIKSYDDWWKLQIAKNVREKIRGAERKGVRVKKIDPDEDFFLGALSIYNETPIRQGLRYSGYGMRLSEIKNKFENLERSDIIGAYFGNKLIGFIWIVYGDQVASIESFVSFISERSKAPNNLLMAETVRQCCDKNYHFLWYARMGYLEGLDSFRKHNGFVASSNTRYFVPLSARGALAIRLGLHKSLEYALSPKMVRNVMPLYSLANRLVPLDALKQIIG